jgi:hypothetical protein
LLAHPKQFYSIFLPVRLESFQKLISMTNKSER